MSRSILNDKIEFAGKLPEGSYTFTFNDILIEENVMSISGANVPQGLFGKEKATLTPEQIALVEKLDPGRFEHGNQDVKPRYQNRTTFVFTEDQSGTSVKAQLWGGPKINKGIKEFLEQATGADLSKVVGNAFVNIIKPGEKFTGVMEVAKKGDFTNLNLKTVRKVGLPPLANVTTGPTVNSAGFTDMEEKVLKYLEGDGKGMKLADVPEIYNKGIVIDGVPLSDFGAVVTAFNGIMGKVKSYDAGDGTVLIVRK